MSDAEALIGPVGAAALDEARHALRGAADGAGLATLRVAGWTRADWSFRFELAGAGATWSCTCPMTAARWRCARPALGPTP